MSTIVPFNTFLVTAAFCATVAVSQVTPKAAHAGDLPNFEVGPDGYANVSILAIGAHTLGVNSRTLRLAVERGEIEAEHPLADGPWVFNRRAMETEAAAHFLARVRSSNRNPAIPTSQQRTLGFSTT